MARLNPLAPSDRQSSQGIRANEGAEASSKGRQKKDVQTMG
jgi:hypothetical protein